MKTPFRAFSLVELLLVVTILSIVCVTGFSSFSRLSSWGEGGEITGKISGSLRELDERIASKKMDSYEVVFEKWAAGYIIRTEDVSASGSLDINWNSGTGTLHVESDTPGIWTIPFLVDNLVVRTAVFSGSVTNFVFRLPQTPLASYQIRPSLQGILQNAYEIRAFSLYGLTGDRGIWTVSGLPWAATKVVIRNIRGNRTMTDGGSLVIPSGSEIEISNHGKSAVFTLP